MHIMFQNTASFYNRGINIFSECFPNTHLHLNTYLGPSFFSRKYIYYGIIYASNKRKHHSWFDLNKKNKKKSQYVTCFHNHNIELTWISILTFFLRLNSTQKYPYSFHPNILTYPSNNTNLTMFKMWFRTKYIWTQFSSTLYLLNA